MRTREHQARAGVEVLTSGPVAEVIVGHGARHNAMTDVDWTELADHVERLGLDGSVRVVIVRGGGDSFSAGSDLAQWINATPEAIEESFRNMESALTAVERCPVPVLAQVAGVAAGAGCQLALACDMRLMADSARVGMPIARLGIMASPSFAARLVTVGGAATARRLLYAGELVDAQSALRLGLVDETVPTPELAARVRGLANRIAHQPPAAIRAAKRAVAAALRPVRDATEDNPHPAVTLGEFRAGVAAFLEHGSKPG
jgi:enoyl-CoA hydratase/carnithine racemase